MHNTTQIMHKTLLAPAHVHLAGVVEIERDVQLHQHPIFELVYYLRGDVQCRIDDTVVECCPGMMRLIPPGVIHGEIVPTSFTCLYIWLEAMPYLDWPCVYVDDTGGTVVNLCQLLVREWNGQSLYREEMIDSLIYQLDILLRRAHDQLPVSSAERLVREGERLLKERFATSITIGEIATTLGVSPSYLRTHFIEQRGQTPMMYLQSLRVQHALALIQNSDLSLEAVARLCGYDSASHLSRHVKRTTGLRPGTFRVKGVNEHHIVFP